MISAIKTYLGQGVEPVYGKERALNLPVKLPANIQYPKGQCLGVVVGTGTDVNDVQTITPSGTVSGGTWRAIFNGQVTASLAYNASAATVKAALAALPSIGDAANLTVTGGGLNSAAFIVTFIGAMAGINQPIMSVILSLTGSGATAAVTHTTPGKPAGGYYAAYDDSAVASLNCVLQYPCATDSVGNITFGDTAGAADHGMFEQSAPAWFEGEFRGSDLTGLDADGVADVGRVIAGDPSALTAATTIIRFG